MTFSNCAPLEVPSDAPQLHSPARHRVLVVDDSDAVQELARDFLEMEGYDVIAASRGDEALAILEQDPRRVDLILTDHHMPGMTGCELVGEVAERWPKIKLILVSGLLEEEDRVRIESLFRVNVLAKPYRLKEVIDLIRQLLGADAAESP